MNEVITIYPKDDNYEGIPKQLSNCKFVLIHNHKKAAFEDGLYTIHNYDYESARIRNHIAYNHNYGVVLRNGLCCVDGDHVLAMVGDPFYENVLSKTFSVRTGRTDRLGVHFYFYCPELESEKFILELSDGTSLGDVRGSDSRFYTVGPGSNHPSGNKYEVLKDVEPVHADINELRAFIDRYKPIKKDKPKKKVLKASNGTINKNESISDRLGLKVSNYLMPVEYHMRGDELEGTHPIHGSTTGSNFTINPNTNQWYCRRCGSGGDALSAFAISEGICNCSDFNTKNGTGIGDHWKEVFEALKKAGFSEQLEEMNRERGISKNKNIAPDILPGGNPKGSNPVTKVNNSRPEIVVNGRQLRDVTYDAISAIHEMNNPPESFIRSGKLSRINIDERGIPRIDDMTKDIVRERSTHSADFIRVLKDGSRIKSYPPMDLVSNIMSVPSWPFPAITGIIEAPSIRIDGSIISKPGYDPITHQYYSPSPDFRNVDFNVSEIPTEEEVSSAKKIVNEIIVDFPFIDMPSRINTLGILLTPVIRDLVPGMVPMCVIDKPQPGTGASLLTDVIGIISTGRPAAMITAPTTEEEWRKTVTTTLKGGRRVITVDNVHNKLHSAVLASVLTSESVNDRILGRTEEVTIDNRTVWIVNGNNVSLGGDLPRRCYWIRMDAKMVRPQERTEFRHTELKKYVRENRAEILKALLTLARSWIAAGRPEGINLPRLGGFEEWVSTVGGILSHAGYTDFMGNQEEMYDKNDVDTPQWEAFLQELFNTYGNKPVTAATIAGSLDFNVNLADALPDFIADAYMAKNKSMTRILGKALAAKKDVRFTCGLMIERASLAHKVVQWKVTRYD